VLQARAREVVGNEAIAPPPDQTTLFIAGHGTGNNENSRQAIERQVGLLRGQGLYADVQPCFMEEDPRVTGCARVATTPNVIVVPFFISDGLHSFEDIPVMLGESPQVVQERMRAGVPTWKNPTEVNGKRIWYSSSVGREPGLAEVILQRVREASHASSG
jgi:sirohydrochlorin cobaltochelatase